MSSEQETPTSEESLPTQSQEAKTPTEAGDELFDKKEEVVPEEKAAEAESEGEEKSEDAGAESIALADLTVPEGVEIPEESGSKFMEIMNNRELSPKDQAQALLNLQAEVSKEASEKGSEAWAQMQKDWLGEIEADPEIGKGNLESTKSLVGGLLDKYPIDGVREAFDLTGAGNHPAIVRLMAAIAKDLGEGKPVSGQPASAPVSQADRLYGSN